MAYDPRTVANSIIDLSLEREIALTHLAMHKILYFLHGRFLVESRRPLVLGYFEAWKFGPVHPLIFSSFKAYGSKRITSRARKLNVLTGEESDLPEMSDGGDVSFVREYACKYLEMPAGRLVYLSHAKGSPWDVVTYRANGKRLFGDRLPNELIRERYHRHLVPVGSETFGDDLDEQSPA